MAGVKSWIYLIFSLLTVPSCLPELMAFYNLSQGMYNATTRQVEKELLPCLRCYGMKFYAYNPLAGAVILPLQLNYFLQKECLPKVNAWINFCFKLYSLYRWPPDRKVPLWRQRWLPACRTVLWQQLGCSIQRQVRDQPIVLALLLVKLFCLMLRHICDCLPASVRYWKESHFHAIDRVLKTLDTVYGSQKPTLTSAAMRWMYHHSQLQVPDVHGKLWQHETVITREHFILSENVGIVITDQRSVLPWHLVQVQL